MDPLKALKYRYTRYCVNRAYVNIDTSNKPADFVNFLEDIIDELRDLEREFGEDLSKAESLFRTEIMNKYNEVKERDREIAKQLFLGILRNCLDIEEIAESKLGPIIRELIKSIEAE